VKANQPKLFDAVSIVADNTAPVDSVTSRDNGRSRAEDRTVEIFPVGDALAATEWHSCVKTIIRVTRRTLLRSAVTGLWTERGEVAFYVSSARDLPPTVWAAAIRGHWGIENRNHYVRDVSSTKTRAGSGITPESWPVPAALHSTSCAKTASATWQRHSGTAHSASITFWRIKESDQR
jgi:hypothetical protein